MANVLLTQKCVRSCPYCFAKKHMNDSPPDDILTWENLIYIADFLQTSEEQSISLLGGEPFLHPQIIDYILYLISRGIRVTVFTSGIMSDDCFLKAVHHLQQFRPDQLSFVCNLNNPEITPFSELENIKRFLSTFSNLTVLSINIYKVDFNLDYAIQYINRYGLNRHIRIGLAHPIPGKKNTFIPIHKLQLMADRFISYIPTFEQFNIEAGFDCGVPLCLFDDDSLGKLFKLNKGNLKFGCGPAIDIGPDMNVWSCFPLSNYQKKSLFEFKSIHELYDFYLLFHNTIRTESGGIFEKCDNCNYRRKELCNGGCLAHSLNNFINEENVRYGEVYPNE